MEEEELEELISRSEKQLAKVIQRHTTPCFSAVCRPFCAVFPPLFRAFRLPGAKTERTGEKWRTMGEIWARNGRETAALRAALGAQARERGWSQNDRTGAGLPPAGPRARTPVSPSGTGEVRFNPILIRFNPI